MTEVRCPDAEELRAFLTDSFSGDSETLEKHLENCASCLENLKLLQPDRRMVQALRGQPEAGQAPLAEAQIGRRKALAQSTVDDPHATAAYDREAAPDRWPTVPGYEVLGELGRGGMGVVYKARQAKLNRLVALKMIRDSGLAGTHERERFRREAEAVARLQHPSIVQIYEVGEADGHPFFSLEYVEGGNLADQCDGRPMPPHAAAEMVERLARAMAYAHRRGIVHRDLKPANVLLDADGTPKVSDFGLAKELDSDAGQTRSGAILGTPAYMAPEQAAGLVREIGPAADVYALGAILYQLLCGEAPFSGTVQVVLYDAVHQEPRRLRDRNRAISRDLEAICLKCLEKDPHRRYDGAETLANELRRIQANEPLLHTRPVGRTERLWRWCRRNPAVASLGTVAVLALLIGSAVSFYFGIEATEQAGKAKAEADQAGRDRKKAQEEEVKARGAERQARQVSAILALDRGLGFCEQGDVDRGMHWLVRALELLPEEMKDLESTIRANLADWGGQIRNLRMVYRHRGEVRTVAFSPDGSIVLTGGLNIPGVVFWDAETGRLLDRRLHDAGPQGAAFTDRVESMAVSPDGRYLLTGGQRAVRLWNLATGEAVATLGDHPNNDGAVTPPANLQFFVGFSPDGRTAISASKERNSGTVRQWKVPTGEVEAAPVVCPVEIRTVAVRPDGSILLGCHDEIRLVDRKSGLRTEPIRRYGYVSALAVSQDGIQEVEGGWSDIKFWDTRQKKVLWKSESDVITSVALTPDNRTILAASRNASVRLLNAATGTRISAPLQHGDMVMQVAISRDGKRALTACRDGSARLWDLSVRAPASRLLAHRGGGLLCYRPDGKELLSAEGPLVRVWNLTDGSSPATFDPGGFFSLAYSPDGKTILIGDKDYGEGRLGIWDAATRQQIGGFNLPAPDRIGINLFLVSPDGRTALIASIWHIYVYDMATKMPLGQPLACTQTGFGAFSADGTKAVVGSLSEGAWLLDTVKGKPIAQLPHQGSVTAVAWDPDQQSVLTATRNTSVFRWDATTGKLLSQPLEHPDWYTKMAFSPDSSMLLTTNNAGSLRLWNVATGKPIFRPITVASGGWNVAFHPDGKSFAVPTSQGVHLFDLPAPVEGTVERLRLWVEVITGKQMDGNGVTRVLNGYEWHKRRQRLQALSGQPEAPTPVRLRHSRPVMVYLRAEDRKKYEQTITDQTRTLANKPDDTNALVRRGVAHCWLEHWDEAEADFRRANVLDPTDSWPWVQLAGILLLKGDRSANREWCAKMLDQLAAPGRDVPESAVLICTLIPLPAEDHARLLRLADEVVQRKTSYHRLVKGAVLFRTGQLQEAVPWLHDAERKEAVPWVRDAGQTDVPLNWCFLALAHHHLGHAQEARSWLDKAGDWIAENIPDEASGGQNLDPPVGWIPYWGWQVVMRLVYREARELILKQR